MVAFYQHKPEDALQAASAAQAASPAVATHAAYLMAKIYLQPSTESLWSGAQLESAQAGSAARHAEQVLQAVGGRERAGEQWQVRAPALHAC